MQADQQPEGGEGDDPSIALPEVSRQVADEDEGRPLEIEEDAKSVCLSQDEQLLFLCCSNGDIKIWNLRPDVWRQEE